MQNLDIGSWYRKEQFYFFKDFDNPFFNVCTKLEVSDLISFLDSREFSFSMTILYAALRAANENEPLRYRLVDDRVVIHDRIDAGHTILNTDESFSFCYFKYHLDFEQFFEHTQQVLSRHRQSEGGLDAREEKQNIIHCSSLPWITFTSFSHARNFDPADSIPKFVFGKYSEDVSGTKLPFSIEVHHALMDGIHISHFLEHFQEILSNPELLVES